MSDIRDEQFRARLPHFEMYLGAITVGGSTEALQVRSFQKGTFMVDVEGISSDCEFIVEGTNNKGENKWFNLDPCDENWSITTDGLKAATYDTEPTWIRLRWISGAATSVKVSANISKTIVGAR